MNKGLALCLGVSIIANVILGLMYFGERIMVAQADGQNQETNKQVNQLKNETNKKDKTLYTLQQNAANFEIEQNEGIKNLVKTTFKELFNYDNKNYQVRFDQVRSNLDDSVISKLRGSGEIGNTRIQFSNQVKALTVYLSAVNKNQTRALVNMETQYAVGGNQFPRKIQMYEVTVIRQKDKWIIDQLDLLGSVDPYQGS